MYEAIQERIGEYEREILRQLREMERAECRGKEPPKLNNPQKAKTIQKRGQEPLREALYRISGVDLTGIDAIGVETVQVVLSEYGPDLSKLHPLRSCSHRMCNAVRRVNSEDIPRFSSAFLI